MRSETVFNALGQQEQAIANILVHADGTIDASQQLVTSYVYDALGRVIRTNQPDGTHTERTYDDAGLVLTETDELGRVKSYEYDAQGRLTAVELPAVIDPDDSQSTRPRWEYEYDALGQQTLIRDPIGTKSATVGDRETVFTYDDQGRQLSRKVPEGITETL